MNTSEFISQVQEFEAKLFRLACRILTSEDAAKDAVQETLLKLWNKINELQHFKSLEAYAMQTIKFYCYDQLKLKANQHMRIVHQNYEAVEEHNLDEAEDKHLRFELIKKAIEQLPEQQKMVIQLRDIENYSFQEIAEILSITEVAARVNLSRARKQIIQKMKKNNNNENQA